MTNRALRTIEDSRLTGHARQTGGQGGIKN